MVSDCLIVVKDSHGDVFKKIKDKELFHLVKGVSTQYITIKDFNNWYKTLK